MRLLLRLTPLLGLIPVTAHAAQSFVYVAVLPCAAGPACTPEVDVYNANSAGLVTRIPLRSGATVLSAISRMAVMSTLSRTCRQARHFSPSSTHRPAR